MAWRQSHQRPNRNFEAAPDPKAQTEPARPENVPKSWFWTPHDPDDPDFPDDPAGWTEPQDEADIRQTGYCGYVEAP